MEAFNFSKLPHATKTSIRVALKNYNIPYERVASSKEQSKITDTHLRELLVATKDKNNYHTLQLRKMIISLLQ